MTPIYANGPKDWKALQNMVGKVFADLGFQVGIEKDIQLVRGHVNVDVFAEKWHGAISETHIAECKYWADAVGKNVVHSVRTILENYGANTGYIISKVGFEKGAYEAAQNSNLSLLTFDQFQLQFRERWVDYVVDELGPLGHPLRRYVDVTEGFLDQPLKALGEKRMDQYYYLCHKYGPLSAYAPRFRYKSPINNKLDMDSVEHNYHQFIEEFADSLPVSGLMDYFDHIRKACTEGVNKFDQLFGQKLRKY